MSTPRDAVRGVAAARSSKRQRWRLAAVLTRWRHEDLRCAVCVWCGRLGDARHTMYKVVLGPRGVKLHACVRCAFESRAMRGTNSLVAGGATRLVLLDHHALRGTPAFQRGPQTAVEAEAIDRR